MPGFQSFEKTSFSGVDVKGKAVLVHTGWAQHRGSEHYFDGHPFLTAAAAAWLKASGAALVGIDSLNIDDTSGGERPVHSILLGADIPIVEQWSKHNNALKRTPATPPPSLGVSRDSYISIHAVGGESWTKILLR